MRNLETPNDLEEAAKEFANRDCVTFISRKKGFIAGAEWQKEHDAELIEIAYNDGITIGMTKQKEQMMKEAVAVEVVGDKRDLRLVDSTQRCLFNANRGDWLKIIIVKEARK